MGVSIKKGFYFEHLGPKNWVLIKSLFLKNSVRFQWTATEVKLQVAVIWYAFNFFKPFGYKLLGVFFKFQSDG